MSKIFVGRKKELKKLKSLTKQSQPQLVVINGRRRIGKSRLVGHFGSLLKENAFWVFEGIAPVEGMTAQMQRDHFAQQIAMHLKSAPFTFTDWNDGFAHLRALLKPNDNVLLDEISWMGSSDPTFIPKLKSFWDQLEIPVICFICGSVSTWIEENIINSRSFFWRINLAIHLKPLDISDSHQMLLNQGYQGSTFDTYKLLGV